MATDIKPAEFSINSTLLEKLKKEGTVKTFAPDTVLIDENDYYWFIFSVLILFYLRFTLFLSLG